MSAPSISPPNTEAKVGDVSLQFNEELVEKSAPCITIPRTGTKVRDVSPQPNAEWVEGTISIFSGGNLRWYNVMFAPAGDQGTYCRPATETPYRQSEYEELFGLGIAGKGWTPNKTILLVGIKM